MKNKLYNWILIILIILLVTTMIFIFIKYDKNRKNDEEIGKMLQEVKTELKIKNEKEIKKEEGDNEEQITYKGYNVLGIISIPKIEIEYPILDSISDEAMKVSVVKFYGDELNEVGNFSIAGHNYLDGRMFGKLKNLEKGDKIEITDYSGRKIEYDIFKKYVIDPKDLSCVKSENEDKRELTLITCINRRKNRLIIKARESE